MAITIANNYAIELGGRKTLERAGDAT